jgi:hypothetical protein
MDIVIAEFKSLHVPTTIAEKLSKYEKTWEEKHLDEASQEIVKALEDKTITVIDIQHILESRIANFENDTIVEDIGHYIREIFEAKQFYKLNLKSPTPEEAAIELLKQTKPRHTVLREILTEYINPIRVDLFREYKKIAHLIVWKKLCVLMDVLMDIAVNNSNGSEYALFALTFRDYVPYAHYIKPVMQYLPKCNKYSDELDGYTVGIQKCGCYFHTESILELVMSGRK